MHQLRWTGPARDGDRGEARTDQLGGKISLNPNPLKSVLQARLSSMDPGP
jgi:hypothetical protein